MEKSSGSGAPLPPLRPTLEAVPIDHQGEPMVMLRDTEDGGQAFILSRPAMFLASLLDGKRTVEDLQTQFTRQTGAVLQALEILHLIQQLEKASLVDTSEARDARRRKREAYLQGSTRPAVHAGGGYPAERLELTTFLAKFFTDPKGPGKNLQVQNASGSTLGLLAPHIDFHRGGPAYAWAYGALAETSPPDVIVAIGVAHASPNSPWVMTRKAYETPFGPMNVDPELFDAIQKCLWYDATEEEIVHQREHSLEFQAVWLKYLWQEAAPQWVPILTSAFERFADKAAPSTVPLLNTALEAIGTMLRQRVRSGEKILILGGVDFAHVGPRFGDGIELSPTVEKKIEAADRASFKSLVTLDADRFYLAGTGKHAWRKVCGLSATYTVLRWMKAVRPEARGHVLAYGQAPDPLGGIVSFSSVVYR